MVGKFLKVVEQFLVVGFANLGRFWGRCFGVFGTVSGEFSGGFWKKKLVKPKYKMFKHIKRNGYANPFFQGSCSFVTVVLVCLKSWANQGQPRESQGTWLGLYRLRSLLFFWFALYVCGVLCLFCSFWSVCSFLRVSHAYIYTHVHVYGETLFKAVRCVGIVVCNCFCRVFRSFFCRFCCGFV